MKYQRIFIAIAAIISIAIVLSVLGQGFSRSGQAEEVPLPTPIFDFQPEPTATLPMRPTDAPMTASAILFSDKFDTDESLYNWIFLDLTQNLLPEDRAVWTVEDGHLVQDATGPAGNAHSHGTLAVTGPLSWTEYTITAKVYNRYNSTFGLVARRQGNDFYRYRIVAKSSANDPLHILEKVVDGVATPLVEVDGTSYESLRWYTVSMSVSGSTITASLDGEVVAEATDTTLANGQGGLYTLALGGILFDDVTVVSP
jgi:hypothetical protein